MDDIVHIMGLQTSPGVYEKAKTIELKKSEDEKIRSVVIEFPKPKNGKKGRISTHPVKFLALLELSSEKVMVKKPSTPLPPGLVSDFG